MLTLASFQAGPPIKWRKLKRRLEGEKTWVSQLRKLKDPWFDSRGRGVKVAILDSGICLSHDDFKQRQEDEKLFFKDFTVPKGKADDQAVDTLGHGTHCAGIIAGGFAQAEAEHSGHAYDRFEGMAPEVSLYIGRVINQEKVGYIDWLVEGIKWAVENEVDIISLSVCTQRNSRKLYQVIHDTLAKGICILAAAGNEGGLAQNGIGYPSRYGAVITVAAHDEFGRPSGFSSSGGEIDFLAPGSNIWSTFLNGRYASLSGTSMAVPFVVGLAALIIANHRANHKYKQKTPIFNNEDLKEHLLRMAAHPGFHDQWSGYGPLLPFQVVNGKDFSQNYPDLSPDLFPTRIHSRPGESKQEADDRADYFQLEDPNFWKSLLFRPSGRDWADKDPRVVQDHIISQARSICFIVEEDKLQREGKFYVLKTESLTDLLQGANTLNPYALPLGPHQRFRQHPAVHGFTGFLVGDDLIMTCRHGFIPDFQNEANPPKDWKKYKVIFGYRFEKAETEPKLRFLAKDVFDIIEMLEVGKQTDREDWAILRINDCVPRPYQPLALPTVQPTPLPAQTPVYLLGHPFGMPLQMASDARVFGMTDQNSYFTDLDAFAGNSGSPVFDANTFELIGIFARGLTKPFKKDQGETHLIANIKEGPGEGEQVQLIQAPLIALQEYL